MTVKISTLTQASLDWITSAQAQDIPSSRRHHYMRRKIEADIGALIVAQDANRARLRRLRDRQMTLIASGVAPASPRRLNVERKVADLEARVIRAQRTIDMMLKDWLDHYRMELMGEETPCDTSKTTRATS